MTFKPFLTKIIELIISHNFDILCSILLDFIFFNISYGVTLKVVYILCGNDKLSISSKFIL